jgi:hypothetical protein
LAVESDAAFQRNRLRSLDAAFLWFVSLFSVFVSLFALAFGRDLAISLMPMLIPIFVMPITEGVLLGVVFRDSLRWRARGWATFGLGIATVLGLVAAQASSPFAPPPTLVIFLSVLVVIFLLVLFAGERLVRF